MEKLIRGIRPSEVQGTYYGLSGSLFKGSFERGSRAILGFKGSLEFVPVPVWGLKYGPVFGIQDMTAICRYLRPGTWAHGFDCGSKELPLGLWRPGSPDRGSKEM